MHNSPTKKRTRCKNGTRKNKKTGKYPLLADIPGAVRLIQGTLAAIPIPNETFIFRSENSLGYLEVFKLPSLA